MKASFSNQVHLRSPTTQIFEVHCRYDGEWKTNFLTLYCTDVYPKEEGRKNISEEMTICLNTKKEAADLIRTIKAAMKEMK